MFDLSQNPGRYIMRVASGILHQLDSFVANTSMTPMEARALQFIAMADRPLYQKDIEAEYGYSPATVSELVKGMEAKGLIRRAVDPEDRRRRCLTIAPGIAPQVEEMRKKMIRMEEDLVAGIDGDKLEIFMEAVRKMSENIPPRSRE